MKISKSTVILLFRRNYKKIYLLLICFLVLFLRRPDALTNPQFWAEDGRHWYAEAYNDGLSALFYVYAGTLQIAMRMVGQIATLLPFSIAPLFFTCVALSIKILPVILLFSDKFKSIIPSRRIKLLASILYICVPNASEVHANLTNINWHLVLICFMILIGSIPRSRVYRLIEYLTVVICGLTGPFAFFLSVVGFAEYWKRRHRHTLILTLLLLICSIIQFTILLSTKNARQTAPLGIDLFTLIEIIGFRIGGAAVLGQQAIAGVFRPPSGIYVLFGIITIATFALAFKNGPRQLRLLIVLTGMLLIAALLKPIASDSMPQWFALLVGAGSRYFFIPTLAFYACVIYLALNKAEVHTYIGFVYKILLVLVLLVAIPTEFNYQPRDDYDFEVYAAKFKSSNRSEKYCLPIPPEWDMCLDKK